MGVVVKTVSLVQARGLDQQQLQMVIPCEINIKRPKCSRHSPTLIKCGNYCMLMVKITTNLITS